MSGISLEVCVDTDELLPQGAPQKVSKEKNGQEKYQSFNLRDINEAYYFSTWSLLRKIHILRICKQWLVIQVGVRFKVTLSL